MNVRRWLRPVGAVALLLTLLGLWLSLLRWPSPTPTPRSVPVWAPVRQGERVVLDLSDPAGDDSGPGTYRYPRDPSFVPGTFDLRRFQVSLDEETVHFRLAFGALPNPWGAPEGFGYQRIDIYLRTERRPGRLTAARPGANVRFAPGLGWHYLVRCAPWGGSRLEREASASRTATGEFPVPAPPVPVVARREGDHVIHLAVPRAALGTPGRHWRYYVLVGGYDAFGPDEYRPVTAAGGRWVFGGGADGPGEPNIVDLLAPRLTLRPQRRQLRSPADGGLAVLYPVGGR